MAVVIDSVHREGRAMKALQPTDFDAALAHVAGRDRIGRVLVTTGERR